MYKFLCFHLPIVFYFNLVFFVSVVFPFKGFKDSSSLHLTAEFLQYSYSKIMYLDTDVQFSNKQYAISADVLFIDIDAKILRAWRDVRYHDLESDYIFYSDNLLFQDGVTTFTNIRGNIEDLSLQADSIVRDFESFRLNGVKIFICNNVYSYLYGREISIIPKKRILIKGAILKIYSIPVFYLPILYIPTYENLKISVSMGQDDYLGLFFRNAISYDFGTFRLGVLLDTFSRNNVGYGLTWESDTKEKNMLNSYMIHDANTHQERWDIQFFHIQPISDHFTFRSRVNFYSDQSFFLNFSRSSLFLLSQDTLSRMSLTYAYNHDTIRIFSEVEPIRHAQSTDQRYKIDQFILPQIEWIKNKIFPIFHLDNNLYVFFRNTIRDGSSKNFLTSSFKFITRRKFSLFDDFLILLPAVELNPVFIHHYNEDRDLEFYNFSFSLKNRKKLWYKMDLDINYRIDTTFTGDRIRYLDSGKDEGLKHQEMLSISLNQWLKNFQIQLILPYFYRKIDQDMPYYGFDDLQLEIKYSKYRTLWNFNMDYSISDPLLGKSKVRFASNEFIFNFRDKLSTFYISHFSFQTFYINQVNDYIQNKFTLHISLFRYIQQKYNIYTDTFFCPDHTITEVIEQSLDTIAVMGCFKIFFSIINRNGNYTYASSLKLLKSF